jgi:ABC-type thiamin/hydroxymethylpyrimidine transport system permease subunit
MYLEILIAGFGGGVVRGLIGYIKHQYSYKNIGFNLPYFFGMSFLSGIVGVLCAASVKELGMTFFGGYFTSAMSFIVGYAGGDFIENIYKTILGKPSLYEFPKE